jgi:hypothetical protein
MTKRNKYSTSIRPLPELIAKKSKDGLNEVKRSLIFDDPISILYVRKK